MVQKNSRLIAIAGPTACGKTSLGIELARRLDGEIVSVDSMQIYQELSIGTAKPTAQERCGIPHHMIDIVSCFDEFTVSDFVTHATTVIDGIVQRGKQPILVGGTGLYYRALIYGYDFRRVDKDEDARNRYTALHRERGAEYLHGLLQEKSSVLAEKIHPNDVKRVIRALETADSAPLLRKQTEPVVACDLNVIEMERALLYERINLRVDEMFDSGLIGEVESLLLKGLSPQSQAMQAIGYREVVAYLRGGIALKETKETMKQNTRRYAKRQLTFFRGMDTAEWLSPEDILKKYE